LCMGGAIKRVAADATAFSHRNATWIVNICGSWTPQEAAEPSMRWVRETVRLLTPHLTAGSYVNFGGSEDAGAMPDKNAYGAAWDRLRKIKTQYDPDNFFRMNANVPPL
jgi:hypothetical protein